MDTKNYYDVLFGQVAEFIAVKTLIDMKNIKPESKIIQDLSFDSLDKLEFASWMEKEFQVKFSCEQIEAMETLGQAVDMVAANKIMTRSL